MSNFIETFSFSFPIILKEPFENNYDYIKNFIPKLPEFFKENIGAEKLKNFHELKNFLGKKRKMINREYQIEDGEIKQNENYFGKNKEIKNISIFKSQTKNLIIKNKEEDKYEEIIIYDKPIALMEIIDPNLININLINDNIELINKFENLSKYNHQIYSLTKGSKKIWLNGIALDDNKIESFEIEKEIIIPYLAVIEDKIPNTQEED